MNEKVRVHNKIDILLKHFVSVIDTISEWSSKLLRMAIPIMVLALVIEVIFRYFFRAPTVWAHEMGLFAWGYAFILGGAYVEKKKAHIRVDILYGRLSDRSKAVMDVIAGLLLLFFISIFIYITAEYALYSYKINEHSVSAWAPPLTHFRTIVPVGAFLLLLQGLANWLRSLFFAITNKDLPS